MLRVFSKWVLERPWYRSNDTEERNAAARRGYEAVLIVTLRHPDSREYEQFAQRVRLRAVREYGYDVYGDEVRQFRFPLSLISPPNPHLNLAKIIVMS